MADGDPLLIGRNNNGNLSTVLARSGVQSNSAVIVTNGNGKGLQASATDNGVEALSASGIGMLATSKASTGVRGVGRPVGVEGVGQSATRREFDSVGVSGSGYRGVYGTGSYTGVSRFHDAVGVFGESQGGTGVRGVGNTGVRGTGNTGVRGDGGLIAVQGRTTEVEAVGVLGESPRGFGVQGDGGILGVLGQANDVDGTGVVGEARQGTGVRGRGTIGVQALATDIGVAGQADNVATPGHGAAIVGVSGHSNAGHGVFGKSTAPEFEGVIVGGVTGISSQKGVVGESTGQNDGVFGRANDPQGAGVHGFSASGIGVLGESRSGIAAWFNGPVQIVGDLFVQGAKSAVLRDSTGKHRCLYAIESPESWFEDFGFAKLVRGRIRVVIKRDFAQFIHSRDYYVFLTPEGDSKGLYVMKKSAKAFEVGEQQDGQSNTRFCYRIVAKRRDLRSRRLEAIRMPKVSPKLDGRIAAPKLPRLPSPTRKTDKSRAAKSRRQ